MPQRVQTLRTTTKNQRPANGSRESGELYVNFPDKQLGFINASKAPEDLIAVRFFSAATNYAAGDFVIEAGRGYRAKTTITAGPFDAMDWETIPLDSEAEPPIDPGTAAQYWRGDKTWQTLDKSAVGLGNVDNTSDASKPISSATATALALKANLNSPTLTGSPSAPTPAVGDNDTSIATTEYVMRDFVQLTGDVMTGPLTIADGYVAVRNPNDYPGLFIDYNGAFGGYVGVTKDSANRYQHYFDDNAYYFKKFNDAGVGVNAFTLFRSDGLITVAGDPTTPLGIATKQYVDLNIKLTQMLARPYNFVAENGSAPASGQITTNLTAAAATKVFVNETPSDASSNIGDLLLTTVKVGGNIILQKSVNNYLVYEVSSVPVDQGSYIEIPVIFKMAFGSATPVTPLTFMFAIGGGGGGGVKVSDTPPALPQPGTLWFESDTGILYVYYDDGNTKQWVQVNGSNTYPSGMQRATADWRNLIVNGGIQVSQENPFAQGITGAGLYVVDQWAGFYNGPTGGSLPTFIAYDAVTPTTAGQIGIIANTAYPTLAADNYAMFQQPLEGLDISVLNWGRAEAIPAVLDFEAYSDIAGSFAVSIRSGTADRSCVFPITFAAGETATWKKFSLPIPAITSGAFARNNVAGATLSLVGMCGTTFQTPTPGAWANGNYLGVAGHSNILATSGKSMYFRRIGLYADPLGTGLAPRFVMPGYAEELARCQRYYTRSTSTVLAIIAQHLTTTAFVYGYFSFPSWMRTSPSVSFSNIAYTNAASLAVGVAQPDAFRAAYSGTAGTSLATFAWYANARM